MPERKPDRFIDVLDHTVRDHISRVVAFVLAPLLALAVPPVTNAINSALGTGYNDQQLSNIAIAIVVGLALTLWAWLRGRAEFETAAATLKEQYDRGASAGSPPPSVTPVPRRDRP